MIEAGAQVDVSKCLLAFRSYKAATQKKLPDIINRFARNSAFQAAHFTPIGSAAQVKSDLMKDPHLRYALTSLLLKRLGGKTLTKNQLKYNQLNRLSRTKGLLGKGDFQRAVDLFVAREMASIRYLRAGWAQAVEDLGGTFRGVKFKGAKGFADKATISRVIAKIVNSVSEPNARKAAGAEKIGKEAIKKGINAAIDDMLSYATSELAKQAAAHSGK